MPRSGDVLHAERKPSSDRRLAPEVQPDQTTPQSRHADAPRVRRSTVETKQTEGRQGGIDIVPVVLGEAAGSLDMGPAPPKPRP